MRLKKINSKVRESESNPFYNIKTIYKDLDFIIDEYYYSYMDGKDLTFIKMLKKDWKELAGFEDDVLLRNLMEVIETETEMGEISNEYYKAVIKLLQEEALNATDIIKVEERKNSLLIYFRKEKYLFVTEKNENNFFTMYLDKFIKDEGINWIKNWENFIFVSDKNKREVAQRKSIELINSMSPEDWVVEAGNSKAYMALNDELGQAQDDGLDSMVASVKKKIDDLVLQSKQKLENDYYEEIYNRLEKDLIKYLKENGYRDPLKAPFVDVDMDGLFDQVKNSMGMGFISSDNLERFFDGVWCFKK